MLGRLANYEDIFQGQPQPIEDYLNGISRQMLLNTAVHLLGFRGFQPYAVMLPMIFGPHNQYTAQSIADRLYELQRQDGVPVSLVSDVAKLRFYEFIFQRADQPQTQEEPEMELNILKVLVILNSRLDNEYAISEAHAPALLGVPELVRYILIHLHAGYDVDQERAEEVIIAQMYKFVLLFQFMETRAECQFLLSALLTFFNCATWQEYAQNLFRLVKAVNEMLTKPGRMILTVEPGNDFERYCAFLDHFTLAEGTEVIQKDFFSVRAYPLYKAGAGEYVIVYPRFVLELLHKGLFFRLQQLNNSSMPRLIPAPKGNKGQDWGSFYKKNFSEEYLLTPTLDAALQRHGIALSGKEIETSGKLKNLENGEPDYYFRSGKRVMLFESKDVNINKDVKTGDKFAEFAEAVRSRFYRPSTYQRTGNDKLSETAILQLVRNIRRLLGYDGGWPIDKEGYTAKNLIFYPIVVVHDRSFRMPGLNVLVNSWFQEEMAFQRRSGMAGGIVKPLVIIDIDTLLAYQDHFARKNNRLVLWEAIDAYYEYIKGIQARKPRRLSKYAVKAIIWKEAENQALSFADFLSRYAGGRLHLAPVAETQRTVLKSFLQSSEYNQPSI